MKLSPTGQGVGLEEIANTLAEWLGEQCSIIATECNAQALPPAWRANLNTKQKTLFGGVREKATYRPIETGNVASDLAADCVRIRTNSQAARIYRVIHAAGSSGMTDTEIESATQIHGNSERPRRLRLQQLGYLRLLLGPAPELRPILRDGRSIYIATEKPWPHDEAAGDGQ